MQSLVRVGVALSLCAAVQALEVPEQGGARIGHAKLAERRGHEHGLPHGALLEQTLTRKEEAEADVLAEGGNGSASPCVVATAVGKDNLTCQIPEDCMHLPESNDTEVLEHISLLNETCRSYENDCRAAAYAHEVIGAQQQVAEDKIKELEDEVKAMDEKWRETMVTLQEINRSIAVFRDDVEQMQLVSRQVRKEEEGIQDTTTDGEDLAAAAAPAGTEDRVEASIGDTSQSGTGAAVDAAVADADNAAVDESSQHAADAGAGDAAAGEAATDDAAAAGGTVPDGTDELAAVPAASGPLAAGKAPGVAEHAVEDAVSATAGPQHVASALPTHPDAAGLHPVAAVPHPVAVGHPDDASHPDAAGSVATAGAAPTGGADASTAAAGASMNLAETLSSRAHALHELKKRMVQKRQQTRTEQAKPAAVVRAPVGVKDSAAATAMVDMLNKVQSSVQAADALARRVKADGAEASFVADADSLEFLGDASVDAVGDTLSDPNSFEDASS